MFFCIGGGGNVLGPESGAGGDMLGLDRAAVAINVGFRFDSDIGSSFFANFHTFEAAGGASFVSFIISCE